MGNQDLKSILRKINSEVLRNISRFQKSEIIKDKESALMQEKFLKAKKIISKLRKDNYSLKAKSAELEVELNLKKFSINNFEESNASVSLSAAQLLNCNDEVLLDGKNQHENDYNYKQLLKQTINDRNIAQAECERLKVENMKLSKDFDKNVQNIRNAFKNEKSSLQNDNEKFQSQLAFE